MKTSDRGMEMIKDFEGLRLEAYRCAAGVWTIGYGHTRGVAPGDVITKAEAEKMLASDLLIPEAEVSRCGSLVQNRFDALVSFVFNVGYAAFRSSTLKKMVMKNPDDKAIYSEMMKWKYVTVNGVRKVLPGLEKRRAKEAGMYFSK
ncbi:MAG: lysozyme [Bacteroidales bacterium]|nr:lysozyme [Bacteroidales bacterium]